MVDQDSESASKGPKPSDENLSISSRQVFIFLLTYGAYVVVYFTRKPFSVAKSTLKTEGVHTEAELGAIDTAFLVAYAVGQFGAGTADSIFGARIGLSLCFVGTGVCALIFGSDVTKEVRSVTWMVNGLFQALFFPFIMNVLNQWFPPSTRGRAFGLWTTCQQVGGFATSAFGAYVLGHPELTWHYVFIWPAFLAFALSFVCLTLLQTSPDTATSLADSPAKDFAPQNSSSPTILSFFQVLCLENMLNVGGGYFCIKLVRYIFLGWLPFYLTSVLEYSAAEAVLLSTAFDIAGAVGSIACGFVSDKVFGGRSLMAVAPMCLLCGIFAAAYPLVASYGKVYNMATMGLVGLMVAGPDSVLGGAACAQVCDRAGHPSATTSATGIANGMGSVGAIASGMLPIIVKERYGWNVLFYFLGALCACGALCVLPMALTGYREMRQEASDKEKQKAV
ncbi:hypothetical protein CYMTET_56170 [Cymbomonas tetramitiformis]|uniref:Major facilitator superfamily (MFS) profile domain-containing protein n=1 Tax=Cymbomonas tetramitiformis TaxID=36881 RepID=A0AAE0EMU2_9CHLO|nr:hypothetical protein CYMTET_56170 [Cymbomonas tetramitiformis]|eukprot:gene13451-15896_t